EWGGSAVVVRPGVRSELRRLWEMAPSDPRLAQLMARAEPRRRLLLRTYGIGESHVADLFAESGGDPPGVETSICARNYEIEIDIRAAAGAAAEGERLWRAMRGRLGAPVFATDERSPAESGLGAARGRGPTLAAAEACRGG